METNKKITKNKVYLIANSQIFPINKKISKLGRKLENDLVIQDSMISRYHAEIHLEDGNYFLVDKKSTSGSFINNEKIEKAQIKSGDIIMLANTPLLFMIDSNEMKMRSALKTGTLKLKEDDDPVVAEEKTKPFVK